MKERKIETKDVFLRALQLLGISPDAFGASIGKDRATIYRYISGDSKIPLNVLTNLLDLVYEFGISIVDVLGIEDEDQYYYHATSVDITFPIDVHINDGHDTDFGFGFYLGENLRQSSTWGKLGYSTNIYRFKREKFKDLKVLDFNNLKPIDWLNYVAINRHKIEPEQFPSLFKKYMKLEKGYDLIKGKIADSFSYEVLELLYMDRVDINQAEYSTNIMALGNQYCLKNPVFAVNLEADELFRYDKTLSDYFHHYAEIIQQKQDKKIELILKRPPNPNFIFSKYLKDKYE